MHGRGYHPGGCFRWRFFPCLHAIAGCIGSYWTTCQIPVIPHVSFLLAHMSCCGWVVCHFFIGPYVIFLLVHVAISYSTTRHGAVCPCFIFLFGHVAWQLPSMCLIFNRPHVVPSYFTYHALVHPRVAFLFDHVACPGSTTWSTINSS
jgi:hypothetical protein